MGSGVASLKGTSGVVTSGAIATGAVSGTAASAVTAGAFSGTTGAASGVFAAQVKENAMLIIIAAAKLLPLIFFIIKSHSFQ